jgi:hypothetical protein
MVKKVKFSLCLIKHYAMMMFGGVISFTLRPLYPRGKSPPPSTHWLGGLVGPRTGLDDVEKILDPTGTRTPALRPSSS